MIMEINLELLKQLREETSISLGECKKALEESAGDLEKAKEICKKGSRCRVKKQIGKLRRALLILMFILTKD